MLLLSALSIMQATRDGFPKKTLLCNPMSISANLGLVLKLTQCLLCACVSLLLDALFAGCWDDKEMFRLHGRSADQLLHPCDYYNYQFIVTTLLSPYLSLFYGVYAAAMFMYLVRSLYQFSFFL